eukprot:TRINITY_DN13087_c0_g1_i1.p1 TRINITY_DN13087_c0_g1~~TRINITY_DN13087_c0_g1_i1.p1  ORF type:complete len:302 (-),score=54.98 TRINITY_DN13087_c0_g1_i1:94-978(-)
MEALNGLSVRELRSLLQTNSIPFDDCIEKSELIARCFEHKLMPGAQPAKAAPKVLRSTKTTIGKLSCVVIENDPKPELVVVMCHGFGANAEDLAPIGKQIVADSSNLALRFVFPQASLSLSAQGMSGGYAWWPLDLQRMISMAMGGKIDQLAAEIPQGLDLAREQLSSVITELRQQTGLPLSRFIIGGFSQGSMVTMDWVLRCDENPGAVVAFSGVVICSSQWTELAKRHEGMRVLQSHGTSDMILPFTQGQRLLKLLRDAGAAVEFVSFAGPHTVPPQGIEQLYRLVQSFKSA